MERLDEVDDPEHLRRPGDEPVRDERALEDRVVVLRGADHDEVARPRVAGADDAFGERRRRDGDEVGGIPAAAQDAPPPLLPPPEAERLAESLLGTEEARAEERLDGLADDFEGDARPCHPVEREARPDDPELLVEDDESAPERLEDGFEVRPVRGALRCVARNG